MLGNSPKERSGAGRCPRRSQLVDFLGKLLASERCGPVPLRGITASTCLITSLTILGIAVVRLGGRGQRHRKGKSRDLYGQPASRTTQRKFVWPKEAGPTLGLT